MINIEELRKNITEELGKWDLPSLGVGIIKDGKIELADGFGFKDMENRLPAGADTMYQIGSCSKAFTAAACAKLVDMGKLEWDRPVIEYLPWLRFKDEFTTLNVTVRDLLCHRTGLPRHDAYWIDGPCTRKEMVENLANMAPAWSFRSYWCYQNTCFVAAGMLIEELSGMSWEEFVKKEIFEPLGMTRSSFYVDVIANDPDHAEPYDRPVPTDLNGIVKVGFLKSDREDMALGIGAPYGPAGSIMSTVNDMLKWVEFNLNNGKVGDEQIISEENMKEIHKPQMLMAYPLLTDWPETDFYSYAMGWFTETYRGHMMVEHGGNINGFSALVTMIPDMDLGIVCLANFNDAFNTYSSTYEIIDRYLGITDGNWDERYRGFIAEVFGAALEQAKALLPEKIEGTVPSKDLGEYTGTFKNPTYGNVVIELEDGGLFFTYNKQKSPLVHYHYDTFTVEDPHALYNGVAVTFPVGRNGKIETLDFDAVMNPAVGSEIFKRI